MIIGLLLIGAVAFQPAVATDETPQKLIQQIVTMSKDDLLGDLWMRQPFMLVAGEEADPYYTHPLYKDTTFFMIPHPSNTRDTPIRKLVAMGPGALPALLKRIDDKQITEAIMPPLGQGAVLGGNEQMTLGEVCSVIVGEIVNRYYPQGEFEDMDIAFFESHRDDRLTSDELDALWDAHRLKTIRDEWAGLTKKAHIASLKRDLLFGSNNGREQGAVVRLAYYAPDQVTALAIARISHPVEFINEYYTDFQWDYRGTPRSPNFILPKEFAEIVGAMLSVSNPKFDKFCADWLEEHFDEVTTDPVSEYNIKFNGLSYMREACMFRLMMHTRAHDGLLLRVGRKLIGSQYDLIREEGELILLAIDHPERFTWSDRKWFDCLDTHH